MLKKDSKQATKLSLCNMDFEEPDLVELIQSDLRSEMNKILSESEVEEIEAVASKSYEVNQTQSPFDPNTSRNSAHHNFRTQMGVKRESDEGDVDQPQMVRGEFDVIGSTSLQEMNQHDQMHDVPQEISGHFSVGSYPPDFHSEIGQYPSQVTEHGDLQSLTWLTTVDVQVIRSQALQKLTEHGTVITSSIVDASQANQPAVVTASGDPAEHQSVIQVTPTSNMQVMSEETNGTQQTDASLHQTAHTSRYMPIQPHLSPESGRFMAQPNRYHLQPHPGGGPMGRNSFDGTHMGSRRYLPMGHHHPYPPPQYTPGRGAYVHGGALMHRYHHHPQQQQKVYPKPVYSYSCLIAMALYNSKTGCLPVSEIYNFMMENYPYFKTAPDGWKNSVRHNLSLNKCFEKVEKPNGSQRKGCLWALNPAKIAKMKEEVQKWKRKDPDSIRRSMSNPEELDRELEEMRRSDEEAARRRMVSLTAHGLTTSALHPHHPMHQPRHPPGLLPMHHHTPHMATGVSGPGSHPGTPQRCSGLHFSTELAQQNFALTLARSASHPLPGRTNLYPLSIHDASSSQVSAASVIVDSNNNNNAAATCSEIQSDMIVLTPGGGKSAFFASPHSSSSSNNTSLLGTLTDCTTGLGEELDASLAELAGLHESFWDGSLDAQPGTSSDVGEHFTEGDTKSILPTEVGENSPMVSSDGHIRLPPVIRMLSSSQSGTASPDTPDFKTPTGQMVDNFGRDLAHFASNNIKPVVML